VVDLCRPADRRVAVEAAILPKLPQGVADLVERDPRSAEEEFFEPRILQHVLVQPRDHPGPLPLDKGPQEAGELDEAIAAPLDEMDLVVERVLFGATVRPSEAACTIAP
jgi:hypothetical protein